MCFFKTAKRISPIIITTHSLQAPGSGHLTSLSLARARERVRSAKEQQQLFMDSEDDEEEDLEVEESKYHESS